MTATTIRKGDVVLYERHSSYTRLHGGKVSSTEWRFGTIEAANRAGGWTKLRDGDHGSLFRADLDRGRTIGQVLLIPRTVDYDALKSADIFGQRFDSPDDARPLVKAFVK